MGASRKARNPASSAGPHHRGRLAGIGAAALALLAFTTTPLGVAPTANADELEIIIDPLLSSLSSVAPALTADLTAMAAGFDPSFAADSVASVALPAAVDGATIFQQYVYTPLEMAAQSWIDSPTGEQVDGLLNAAFGEFLIGNGAAGTEADPIGGAGGLWFGDGGAGWDSTEAGIVGGDGGPAGIFGDGGIGGEGGAGAAGGDGGAGGFLMGLGGRGGDGGDLAGGNGGAGGAGGDADGLLFGIGGRGGDGGSGADGGFGGNGGDATGPFGDGGDGGNGALSGIGRAASDLPALAGAGGDGGTFGNHGMVGDYGTIGGIAPSGSAAISTDGSYLVNSDGQVVFLHGLNEVYKLPPYEPSVTGFSNDDAAFLQDNGFNVVRLGVIWSAVEPEPAVYDDLYLASIQHTVQTLQEHGIYVILDMHQDDYSTLFSGEGAPLWAAQDGQLANPSLPFPLGYFFNPAEIHAWDAFWSNSQGPNGIGLENYYSMMLEHVANYFNGNPDIAGIGIMNEPSPGSEILPTLLGSSHFDSQELTSFYDQAAGAIRAVNPNTPIFYEPDAITTNGLPITLGTVDQPGMVLSFHDYAPGSLAAISMQNAANYAHQHDIPAVLTEFGSGGGDAVIGSTAHFADQAQIGWTEWEYSAQGDITTTGNGMGWLIDDPSQPLIGDNIDSAKLAVLAEPFPQQVSGTPDSWSFTNGTFQFSYATQGVDGLGSFPAGSQTEISVPTVEFPNGYSVIVTGGEVVSAPNATELVIASNTGATAVSVTVSPVAAG